MPVLTKLSRRGVMKGFVACVVSSTLPSLAHGGDFLHRPEDLHQWPANLIRAVQQKLNEMDFDAGVADGIMGPNTKRAIRAFQEANDMDIDGLISPALLQALGFEQ